MGLLDPNLLTNLMNLKGLLGETPIGRYVRGEDGGISAEGLKAGLLGVPVFDAKKGAEDAFNAGLNIFGVIKKAGNPKLYQGQHTPPGKDAAPLHDLTGGGRVYPDDVYTHGARYYGAPDEADLFYQAARLRNKPDAQVSIYRAVPYEKTPQEAAAELEKQMAAYMRRGVTPDGTTGSGWYNHALERLQALKNAPAKEPEVFDINPGDWVALARRYAKQHGESALNGKYKIVSKKVKAKELFTNGDSIQEWGWWPE